MRAILKAAEQKVGADGLGACSAGSVFKFKRNLAQATLDSWDTEMAEQL